MSIPGTHCLAVRPTCTPAWPTVQSPTDLSNLHINPLSKKTSTAATYATNTRNRHATSISEQQQIHRKANRHSQSTVDSKNSQNRAALEHACHTPEGAALLLLLFAVCYCTYVARKSGHFVLLCRSSVTQKWIKANFLLHFLKLLLRIPANSVAEIVQYCLHSSTYCTLLFPFRPW